ncbi:MAG: hypothetical protein PHH28_06665, partial [Desulfuromonadaceae bacterium]|nr:hypothetical protein [Desulfuromonadaceae bacterium]
MSRATFCCCRVFGQKAINNHLSDDVVSAFKATGKVTSAWHVPRSSFLLKCFLLGSGVTVRVVPVEDPRINAVPSEAWKLRAKLAFNEGVKSWGSTAEITWSIFTGCLLRDVP